MKAGKEERGALYAFPHEVCSGVHHFGHKRRYTLVSRTSSMYRRS